MGTHNNQQIRIIAGKWRGRKIYFPAEQSIRPTGDRMRETLFNWLQQDVAGSHCLDAFAGSGVLGFEALSRGALSVSFIDSNAFVLQHLRQQAQMLDCQAATFYHAEMPAYPPQLDKQFDIVFLDPPFNNGLLPGTLTWLVESQLLAANSMIYTESAQADIPPGWDIYRQKKAGHVYYSLLTFSGS